MFKWRMEGVHVENGRCSGGGRKTFSWRIEDVQLKDGRCSCGAWKMYR
jgi:hypothetical protein